MHNSLTTNRYTSLQPEAASFSNLSLCLSPVRASTANRCSSVAKKSTTTGASKNHPSRFTHGQAVTQTTSTLCPCMPRGLCVFQPNVLPTHAAPRAWRTCGGLLAARLRLLQEDDRLLDKFDMKAMQQKAECGSGHLHAHIFRQLSASHLPPAGTCLGRISLKSCHQWIIPAGQEGIPPIPPQLRQAHGRRPDRCVLDAHTTEGLVCGTPPFCRATMGHTVSGGTFARCRIPPTS